MKCVNNLIPLTLRITVKPDGEIRPVLNQECCEAVPEYPENLTVGTGWVSKVCIYPDVCDPGKMCTCKDCLQSPERKTRFADIVIKTAAHVLVNVPKKEDVTCHLFFDRGDTPDSCPGVVTIHGMSSIFPDTQRDICQMKCATHDIGLAEKLQNALNEYQKEHSQLQDKYRNNCQGRPHTSGPSYDQVHKLTVIVSHPHGMSKKVSVGYFTERVQGHECLVYYKYTTATCPGSSGAHVFILGRPWWRFDDNIHYGYDTQENETINHSALGIDRSFTVHPQ